MRKIDYDVEYTWKEKPKLEKCPEIKKNKTLFKNQELFSANHKISY